MAEQNYIQLLEDGWRKELADAQAMVKQLATQIKQIYADIQALMGKRGDAAGIKETAQLTKDLAKAQDDLRKKTEDLIKAQKALEALQTQFRKETDALALATGRLTNAQKAVAVEVEAVNRATRDQVAANKAAATIATAATGSLVAMRAELSNLVREYDNLSKEQRENAQVGGVLQKQILATNTALSTAEQGTGRFGRNVGNYTSAVSGFRMQFQQVARELPSLANGLQTFFMAIGNNVPLAVDAFREFVAQQRAARAEGQAVQPVWKTLIGSIFNWQTALLAVLTLLPVVTSWFKSSQDDAADAAAAVDIYNKSLKETATTIGREVSALSQLRVTAENVNISYRQRGEAVDELQRKYPEYFANISREKILNGDVEGTYRSLTTAIIQRAKVTAQNNAVEKLATERAQISLELDQRRAQGISFTDDKYRKSREERLTYIDKEINKLQLQQENEQAAATRSFGYIDAKTRKEDQARKNKQKADALLTEEERAQRDRDAKKKPKVDKTPYVAPDNSKEVAENLAKVREAQAEGLKAIIDDETKSIQYRVNALLDYRSLRIQAINLQYEGEEKELRNSLARIEQIRKKDVSKQTDEERKLVDSEALIQAQIQVAVESGRLERLKVNTYYDNKEREITNKFYKEYTNATEIAEKYLAEVKSGTKSKRKIDQKELEQLRQQMDIVRTYAEAAKELSSILSIGSQTRLAEIDAESAAIERRYNKEIEGVQSSLLTEQEKADKINALREEQFQEEQVQEDKRKQEKVKQAILNKEIAIATIILNTAMAVTGALATAPQNPLATAQAIAAGFLGAAQLAAAIATPIPQYAEGIFGDKSHPGGDAWVGDGGKSEYLVYPNGRIGITPAAPTLVDLPRGTQVFPDADTFIARYHANIPQMYAQQSYPVPESNKPMERLLKQNNVLLGRLVQKPGVTIRQNRRDMHSPFRINR